MIKKSKVILIALLSMFLFSACNSNDTNEKEITVGVTPGTTLADIFDIAKVNLEEEGYTVEIVHFNDYQSPNEALEEGSLDYNFYQHQDFLDEYNETNDSNLSSVCGGVYTITWGLFSEKINSLDEVEDGMSVAIANDPTNRRNGLRMLEDAGLIKLDSSVVMPTVLDITENPHNLEFIEMDDTLIPNALQDVGMGFTALVDWKERGNDTEDAIYVGIPEGTEMVLATREDNLDSEITKDVEQALKSPEVKEYIETTLGDVATPLF